MSDQKQERPLTRRELRLREQAAQEAAEQLNEEDALQASNNADGATIEVNEAEIEIDPLNPDGTPRTRRELRELRQAAIAELEAEQRALLGETEAETPEPETEAKPEPEAETEPEPEAETEPETAPEPEPESVEPESIEPEAESDHEEAQAEDVEAPEADEEFDDSYGAPTEAYSLEDLLDAAEPASPTGDPDAVAALFSDTEGDGAAEAEDAAEPEVAAEPEPVVAADDESGPEDEAGEAAGEDESVLPVAESEAGDPVAAASDEQSDAEADADSHTGGYSFPDIQPPEEWRSVFDDPSRGEKITSSESSGDFDDLISRAVAQEGSTGKTGASALILPSHPGDTGGLTGPLGSTGELFITGSIDLPKSLGETGGHAAVQNSQVADAYISGEQPDSLASTSDSGSMPVSAMDAVSARRRPEVPVVAEPAKEKSRAPLILAISGGTLIVVLAGAVVYAITQGLFG